MPGVHGRKIYSSTKLKSYLTDLFLLHNTCRENTWQNKYFFLADRCTMKCFQCSWFQRIIRVGQGFWVYGILQLKYGYSVYHFLWISVYVGIILGIFGWILGILTNFFGYTGIPLPPPPSPADPESWNNVFIF